MDRQQVTVNNNSKAGASSLPASLKSRDLIVPLPRSPRHYSIVVYRKPLNCLNEYHFYIPAKRARAPRRLQAPSQRFPPTISSYRSVVALSNRLQQPQRSIPSLKCLLKNNRPPSVPAPPSPSAAKNVRQPAERPRLGKPLDQLPRRQKEREEVAAYNVCLPHCDSEHPHIPASSCAPDQQNKS